MTAIVGWVLVGLLWVFVAVVVGLTVGPIVSGHNDYDVFGLPVEEPLSNVREVRGCSTCGVAIADCYVRSCPSRQDA